MILYLRRYSYSDTETEGVLRFGNEVLYTIEQPWVPNPNGAPGGKPFHSCIPDGMYTLLPWTRPNGDEVWIISEPSLGVHKLPDHHERGYGRDLCLIHKGNWVTDIEGCIAPGIARLPMSNRKTGKVEQAVGNSTAAMKRLVRALGRNDRHILAITNETGASDV